MVGGSDIFFFPGSSYLSVGAYTFLEEGKLRELLFEISRPIVHGICI